MTSLTWTERSGSYRAEYRGQLAHVRHLRTGWSWTWGPWSAGGFETAEAAMAAAETTLKQKEAT